jgi:hypothetical protein
MASLILPLDQIKTDGRTQARVSLSEHIIKEYADALERGDEFPPLDVYFDNTTYWLADGFHRIRAFQQAGVTATTAEVHQGGEREALLHAIHSNETHGHRRSDADRRHAVTLMLTDPEWSTWANTEIARQCRVSESLVRTIRHELEPAKDKKAATATRKVTRKGKTFAMDTSRIGSRTPRTAAPPSLEPAAPPDALQATADQEPEPQVMTAAAAVPDVAALSPEANDRQIAEPAADLSSFETKIATSSTERPLDNPTLPSPAIDSPQLPRPLTLIELWQASTPEERQEFIAACHEELRHLLTAYETPPPDHKAKIAQQILAWSKKGMSQRAIASKLNDERIPTISGRGTWNPGQVAKLLAKERQV